LQFQTAVSSWRFCFTTYFFTSRGLATRQSSIVSQDRCERPRHRT
jgi:hypothetical protein